VQFWIVIHRVKPISQSLQQASPDWHCPTLLQLLVGGNS
jgi:hypothetical protein